MASPPSRSATDCRLATGTAAVRVAGLLLAGAAWLAGLPSIAVTALAGAGAAGEATLRAEPELVARLRREGAKVVELSESERELFVRASRIVWEQLGHVLGRDIMEEFERAVREADAGKATAAGRSE